MNKPDFNSIIYSSNSNVSNYVGITSNVLKSYIDTNDTNVSNYVGVTSNLLKSYIDINDSNVSNYVGITSNLLKSYIDNLDNSLYNNQDTLNVIENSNYKISSNNLQLPIASSSVLGGIKQGNNTKIDSSGYIYIDLTKYTGNAVIDGHLTTSNITILGSSTFLNTDVYITERLEIINDGFNNAVDIKQKISGYDIINASNLTNEVFKIDYNGAITFNESINNINKDQFSKIANITTNDSNVSNYVRITSNVLKSYID